MQNTVVETQDDERNFPVVGIGGSAGGLGAFEHLFDLLETDTGAAFVVIQHLKADQPSQLAEILARHTRMPVTAAEHGAHVQPDHVYVATPGRELELTDGHLCLVEPQAPHHPPAAIDRFFRSLATARGARAIGVVFSGMGDDGTLGLKAIKASGGIVLVQDPATAAFDAMPRSAAATHMADRVLDVDGIAAALHSYLRHRMHAPPALGEDHLTEILDMLRRDRRHDFRGYKQPMISRRINRRVQLAGFDSVDDYIGLLGDKPQELERLQRDLLISVTDFFRDPQAYKALQTSALDKLAARAGADRPIRAWIPACATGEEAYTVAMLLSEAVRVRGHDAGIQLFASDIDDKALDIARVGVYPGNVAADIPPDYLRRYLRRTDHHYQVEGDLRQNIVFAMHDLLRDPPYSRLDLISCRNVLIYLSPDSQKYLLTLFHFALREGGYLFLGSAETIGQADDLFEPVDAQHRIYRRLAGAARERASLPFPSPGAGRYAPVPTQPPSPARATEADQIAQKLLLREYVPAAVLINRKAEILCAYGPTQHYLALPTGTSRLDLMDMAADDLRSKLRAVVHQAIRDNARGESTVLRDNPDGAARLAHIRVRPLARPASARGLFLVTFADQPVAHDKPPTEGGETSAEERFAEELRATQEQLQGTIQSLEAANEDMQGSNEEIMSMNEELQSTNEELETSKEELQSLNEELTTVNNELRSKIGELERLNNDLANLFAGTRVATLFLDRNLCIMRYTPPVRDLLYVLGSDVGRPMRDIKLKFEDSTLLDDADAALEHLEQRECEVRAEDGSWWRRRILPYRTLDDSIDGVVISFTDISELKAAVTVAERDEEQLQLLADALPALVAYIDQDLRFVFANAAYQEWFDIAPAALQGRSLESLLGAEHLAAISEHCKAAVEGERVVYKDTLEHQRLGQRSVHVTHVPYADDGSGRRGFYLLATDLTELDRQADAAHANRVASMSELAATIAHQLNQPLGSISNYAGALKRLLASTGGEEPRSVAEKIAIQARAASDILNELREFIGRRTFDQEMVDLNVLIRRVCILTEGRRATVAARMDLKLADDLPRIHASPMQLEQLLVNLFVNALEAMENAPTRRLTVTTGTGAGAGDVSLSVADTGPGVAADKAERIFDTFFTDKADGMGMGLAICRSIVEEHGGTLWLQPDTDGGATFHVRLPATGEQAHTSAPSK